jgi:integrase
LTYEITMRFIYGLKPEDLDWETPMILIRRAWQRYDNPAARSLGDPKWHKIREIAFPQQLQEAIRELWAAYGQHEFVFCNAKGKLSPALAAPLDSGGGNYPGGTPP